MRDDNLIHKRRASDWQQQAPTITKPHVASWYEEEDRTVVIGSRGVAHISTALSGAQAIAAILQQAALGRTEDDVESRLKLCEHIEQGLISALSSCLEVVELHALEVGAVWTTSTVNEDEQQVVLRAAQSINVARFRKSAGGAA